jgi:Transglycosylase SLT domain
MHNTKRWRITAAIGSAVLALTLIACSQGSSTVADPPGNGHLTEVSAPSPTPLTVDTPTPTDSATSDGTPEPPAPTVPPPPPCKKKIGKALTKKQIRADLVKASKINEYNRLDPAGLDKALKGKTPQIKIPLSMLIAVADQESGWQSNCESNDGLGFGTMQVSVAAVNDVNDRFKTSFNRMKSYDNILIGDGYLEHLTAYYGITYFKNDFNLLKNKALRDAVLAAYNVGKGLVDGNGYISLGPKGQQYADTVDALMQPSAPCQSYGK